MSYQLHDDVSFCLSDERFIFLDIRRDRYLCLGASADQAFARLIGGADADTQLSKMLGPLVDGGLLVPGDTRPVPAKSAESASRSLLDEWDGSASVASTIHLLAAQSIWRSILKRRGLLGAIRYIRLLKQRMSPAVAAAPLQRERGVIAGFLMAGRVADSRNRCLLRSFTLVGTLAKRGCAVDLVFGVRTSPFGAHCWAQRGDVVLSDSVDQVRQFTPILVL